MFVFVLGLFSPTMQHLGHFLSGHVSFGLSDVCDDFFDSLVLTCLCFPGLELLC